MADGTENRRRNEAAPPELESLVQGLDFIPERVPRDEPFTARKLLERDGAVILTGWPEEADSLVNAAASVLSTRLRELERAESRTTENADTLALHRDGANVVVDIHDRPVNLRNPDIDYVLILCAAPAQTGGESFVVDGYRLVDRLRDKAPELYKFLTSVDVDLTSGIPRADVHPTPRVSRMVEWTRGGRMIVRTAQYAQPVPRESRWDEHQRLPGEYTSVLATLTARAGTGTALAAGEVLVLDNYRCLHGVRAHRGARSVYVLRCKSDDVW